jgi:hypothetical protein
MAAGLVKKRCFLGRLEQLRILILDILAELDGLISCHPAGEIDPRHGIAELRGRWSILLSHEKFTNEHPTT